MQRALLAALFLAPLCALLGVFVTARRMAFFSDTIAHAGLVGVALGLWLGLVNPTLPLILVSLLIAAAIFWLRERTELLTDTIMALLLSGSVALGIILLSLLRSPPRDIHGFLFGDILAVGWPDVRLAAVLCLAVGLGLFSRLNQLSLLTAQEEMAHVCGVPVRRLNYLFVVVLTLTVAVTIRLLGIILVTALVVIPPAAARNLSRNLRQQVILSLALGLVGGVGGALLSLSTRCSVRPDHRSGLCRPLLPLPAGRLAGTPPSGPTLLCAMKTRPTHARRRLPLPELTARLRRGAWKITGPRQAVLDLLRRQRRPWSVKELFRALPEGDCDLATVYRSIHLLEQMGMVKRFEFGSGPARFELLAEGDDGHHHHLFCTGCSAIVEIEGCFPKALEARIASQSGFARVTHKLEFFGLCPRCQ